MYTSKGAISTEEVLSHVPVKVLADMMKKICPRGNNNIVIIIFLVHDNFYIPC
jgi:hypothetical protein